MKKKDVPQDFGMADGISEVCYAVDDDGKYVLVPSGGWEPKNITLKQAWEVLEERVSGVAKKVEAGELSPLAYYMVKNQMNVRLLSKYVNFSRWRVKRHLKPVVFKQLNLSVLLRYADLFGISVEQLCKMPADA